MPNQSELGSSRRLIVVSGYDRSGKSTFSKRMASPTDAIIEAGEVVRARLGLPRGIELSRLYGEHLDALNGDILNAAMSADAAMGDSGGAVYVVGVRSISLFNRLLSTFAGAVSCFLDVSSEDRYARHVADCNHDNPLTQEQFSENDNLQRGWGIDDVRLASSYILYPARYRRK